MEKTPEVGTPGLHLSRSFGGHGTKGEGGGIGERRRRGRRVPEEVKNDGPSTTLNQNRKFFFFANLRRVSFVQAGRKSPSSSEEECLRAGGGGRTLSLSGAAERELSPAAGEAWEPLAVACASVNSKMAVGERAGDFEDPMTSLTRSNATSGGGRPPVVVSPEEGADGGAGLGFAAGDEGLGAERRETVTPGGDPHELKTKTSMSPAAGEEPMPRTQAQIPASTTGAPKRRGGGRTGGEGGSSGGGGREGRPGEGGGGGGGGPSHLVRHFRQGASSSSSLRKAPSPPRFLLLLPLLPSLVLLTGGPSCVKAHIALINDDGWCEQGWFPCGHTNATHCVPRRLICNKEPDCPNGEDEDEKDCIDKFGDAIQPPNTTKPSVDTRFHCSLSEVPEECVCRRTTRVYCSGAGLTRIPPGISPEVTHLILINNSITLERDSLLGFQQLKLLHLQNNGIEDLPADDLVVPASLKRLILAKNELSMLYPETLRNLRNVTHLYLNNNDFTDIDHILRGLPNLVELFMDYNQISLLDRDPPAQDYNFNILFLEYNEIEVLERDSLAGFGKLTSLFLGDNGIRYIDRRAFVHTPLLLTLSLNNNRLQTLDFLTPGALSSLQDLNVDANPLLVLSLGSVTSLKNLKSLKLQYIEFTSEQLLNISSLDIKVVYFKRFRYCSFLSHIRNCHPKTDGVSSFENLLVQAGLRKAVWVVAFLTITGNLTVIFGRVFSRDENKVLSVFIRNLAVADLLTGIYLLVVGITDKSLEMNYNKYAYEWMTSTKCTATGVLAMTSSQVSIFLLTFMSVERWVCITWPLQRRNLSMKETRWILLIIWILGFSIALAPVFIYQSPQGFYGTNGLCFPLHLDDPWVPGWFYSAIIFAVVNQIGVIVILLAYVSMFSNIRLTRAATPLSLGDREFALRFFFIVFTDCVCWTPIIVLRILALAEVDIDPQFYAYVVVVLLPINSALNPFLYTFTTSKFRSQVGRLLARSRMCRWTRRRDSDSEGTRTSFFRSGTYKWSSNGRSEAPLALHTHHDDTTVSEVVKVPSSSVVNCSKNEVTDVTLKEVALKDVALRIDNGTQQENQHKHNQQQEQLESQF